MLLSNKIHHASLSNIHKNENIKFNSYENVKPNFITKKTFAIKYFPSSIQPIIYSFYFLFTTFKCKSFSILEKDLNFVSFRKFELKPETLTTTAPRGTKILMPKQPFKLTGEIVQRKNTDMQTEKKN